MSVIEPRVARLLRRANERTRGEGISHSQALAKVFHRLQAATERLEGRKRHRSASRTAVPAGSSGVSPESMFAGETPGGTGGTPVPLFLCDAGLGGLARWLRAAGYETRWIPDIDDEELIREAQRNSAVIVTTDSIVMERRVLRDGEIPAVWVPLR